MHEYSIKPFDLVQNSQYKYYKLSIDGYCQFDDFKEEIDNSTIKKEKAAFNRIISYMSMISDSILLPEKKFRQIHNVGRKDVFEFKKDDIRVYVVMQKPDIFVVLGGYKKKQSADIRALKRNLDGFKTI